MQESEDCDGDNPWAGFTEQRPAPPGKSAYPHIAGRMRWSSCCAMRRAETCHYWQRGGALYGKLGRSQHVSEQISTGRLVGGREAGTLWRMKPGSAWFIQPLHLKIPFDVKSSCYIS